MLLLLPFLVAFAFQATQYARAPVQQNFFIVHTKNADIAIRPGNDLSPSGQSLLQNASAQEGLYELELGTWGPGYLVNYTDAFRIYNREIFDIKMIGFNFTEDSTGNQYLRIRVQNDTDYDGIGDSWVTVWDGSTNILDVNHPIHFQGASISGDDGGYAKIEIDLVIPRTGIGISNTASEIIYMGQLRLWFTSIAF
ncbi:MAG: hypothetical protein V1915_03710 [Candidatus Bathyarchaeota archaeon]